MADNAEIFPRFRDEAGRARYLAAYDDALAAWPIPYTVIEAATRFGPAHVVASGPADGPPLVLLPSLAAGAVVWRLNVAGLARVFRTYAVDVIGQPGKTAAVRRLRDRADYTGWLSDVMGSLNLARASIVGCSFGGFLAANQALAAPDHVRGVVLISPVGVFASQRLKLFYLMRVKATAARLARRLSARRSGPSHAGTRAGAVIAAPRDLSWARLMAVTMAERPKLSVISPPVFGAAQLAAIRAPTLLLIGEREQLYAPEVMLALARRRMPGLQTEIVPDADHIAAMAQPDDVNDRITRFLGTA
ncbi:MAG TPA: alpha/beta hydrolase [Caulobacteraceae bacterium]|jgi:pimeloyl-ACP methyl ester carboxylesterase